MKLIFSVNTWEEEVRNAIIHIIDYRISLIKFKYYAAKIAKAIADNDIKKATNILWSYSEKGYKPEHLEALISQLRETYEREE